MWNAQRCGSGDGGKHRCSRRGGGARARGAEDEEGRGGAGTHLQAERIRRGEGHVIAVEAVDDDLAFLHKGAAGRRGGGGAASRELCRGGHEEADSSQMERGEVRGEGGRRIATSKTRRAAPSEEQTHLVNEKDGAEHLLWGCARWRGAGQAGEEVGTRRRPCSAQLAVSKIAQTLK